MNSDADNQAYEAILASLRVWILSVAAALLEVFGTHGRIRRGIARRLRANLRKAEYHAKLALFLLAASRCTPGKRTQRRVFALGYALKRRKCSYFRRSTHGCFNGRPANIRARIDRLRDMLENSEAWIARLVAHLSRVPDDVHRILAAPPIARRYARAFQTPAPADSS